jgi:uncharacterized protein YaaR (DUF327 family)
MDVKADLKIQNYPTADSPATDPFEGLVEVYYQLNGYITSSNKWFWVREEGKQQRGYQDIDVLAINAQEVVIVSVTANLNDKVRQHGDGSVHEEKLASLRNYFDRVKEYLKSVEHYSWLMDGSRKVSCVVAFSRGYGLAEKIAPTLGNFEIEMLSSRVLMKHLKTEVTVQEKRGLRTNNQIIKMIQLMTMDESL